ncbi:hypothetical protein DYB32_008520 [Aphanomyces invadans]|uniref:25S rRNA (uridine-N(3))-methyltransferase BMT5-like domain-containing protein n=1 Tax=Aphanomyces invadans TaxID=157072 RepID=A0A3R6VGK3_9STRA|nr:hypothetical protein DYB32_008520 [Aphanomyces invadans]
MTMATRDLEQLYVATKTLECARKKCVPCGYKIVVHARGDDTVLNQRPELCPRFKAAVDSTPVFPLVETQMKVLLVHDDGLALTSVLKGYLSDPHHLSIATAVPKAQIVKACPDATKRIKKLELQGVKFHFEADVASLSEFGQFDRVIWNFVESATSSTLGPFFASVGTALAPNGQVHLTTKTPGVVAVAAAHGLVHVGSLVFDRSFCPSYKVPYSDCDTFVFEAKATTAAFPDTVPVTATLVDAIVSTCLAKSNHDTTKLTKAAMKKARLALLQKKKQTVDVPYEKEYFDLMNLKPKGKKHKVKRKQEYEANQEGKERPSKRVLPHRMENGKRKKGW